MCLEFSKVTTPGVDSLYDFYSFQIIPPMGKVSLFFSRWSLRLGLNRKHINNISGARWGLGLLSVPGGEHKAVSTSRGICSDDQRCWIQVLNMIVNTELCLIVSDLWILKTSLSEWLQSILVSNCDNILYWILSPTLASCTLNLI